MLVKKQRGPYKDLYDLPGGTQEFGESIHETLLREVREETGIIVKDYNWIKNLAINYNCIYNNLETKIHHTGMVYEIKYYASPKELKPTVRDQDILYAKWVDFRKNDINLTPISQAIISIYR